MSLRFNVLITCDNPRFLLEVLDALKQVLTGRQGTVFSESHVAPLTCTCVTCIVYLCVAGCGSAFLYVLKVPQQRNKQRKGDREKKNTTII